MAAPFTERMLDLIDSLMEKFGSTVSWTRIERVENPDGSITETPTVFPAVRCAVVDARHRDYIDESVVGTQTVILVPERGLEWDPNPAGERGVAFLDLVELQPGKPMRVLKVSTRMGPGATGAPVPMAHVAYLGS